MGMASTPAAWSCLANYFYNNYCMENKRYRQDSKAYEQAYMKWLQKIVYQKEKELATLNESI